MAEINLGRVVGNNAPILRIQYSANGTSWHNNYQNGDIFQRQSADAGSTWSANIPISTGEEADASTTETIIAAGIGSDMGIESGDIVTVGTTFNDFVKRLIRKTIPAAYNSPTLSLSVSPSEVREIGSVVNYTLTPNWNQRDAGSITEVIFRYQDSIIRTQTNLSPYIHNTATHRFMKYSVQVVYGQGPIKNDSLGNPSRPLARIAAGSISDVENINGSYATWFGSLDDYPVALDIRNLSQNFGGSFTLNTGGKKYHVIAIQSNNQLSSVIDVDSLGVDLVSSYVLDEDILTVEDGGGNVISYKVYVLSLATAYSSNHRHQVSVIESQLPVVKTLQPSNVGSTSILARADLQSLGINNPVEIGFAYGTDQYNLDFIFTSSDGTDSTGPFSSVIYGLLPSSSYYVQAFATNNIGKGVGEIIQVETSI